MIWRNSCKSGKILELFLKFFAWRVMKILGGMLKIKMEFQDIGNTFL